MAYCIGYKHPKRGYLFLQRDLKTFSSFPDFWNDEASAKNVIASYQKSLLNRDIGRLLRVIDEYHLSNIENHPTVDLPEQTVTVQANTRANTVVFEGRNMEGFRKDFEDNNDFMAALRQAIGFIETIDDETAKCEKEVFYEELKTQDLLHYIELTDFNDVEGAALAKMIKACRKRRRVAKDRSEMMTVLKQTLNTKRDADDPIHFDAVKRKVDALDRRTYVPRALKTLFDEGIQKPSVDNTRTNESENEDLTDVPWDEKEKADCLATINSPDSLEKINQKLNEMDLPVAAIFYKDILSQEENHFTQIKPSQS